MSSLRQQRDDVGTNKRSEHSNGERRDTTSPWRKVVYAVFFLNAIGLLVLLVGLIAGWFWIGFGRVADSDYSISLVIATSEISKDASSVAEATTNLAKSSSTAVGINTAGGTVLSIAESENRFVLQTEDDELTLNITDATNFEMTNKSSLSDVKVGDQLRVTYQEAKQKYYATNIAAKSETGK